MNTHRQDPSILTNRRWYDGQPSTVEVLNTLKQLPDEVVAVLADGMVYLAERKYNTNDSIVIRKSLGREKILSLYKSKNKRRTYDKTPSLHKAFSYHFMLPVDAQEAYAYQMKEMVNTVLDYFILCHRLDHPPTLNQLQLLTIFYVENGVQGVQRYLTAIERNIAKKPLGEQVTRTGTNDFLIRNIPNLPPKFRRQRPL